MAKILIPPTIRKDEELIAVPKKEYERLKKLDWELRDAKGKIARGMKAWREGRAREISSVRELMQ